MELLYAYLFSKERNIDLGINLNPKYNIKFINNKITIEKTNYSLIDCFYSSNIINMNLLIGENGVGKSSILEIIGANSDIRYEKYNKKGNFWFLLYLINDNEFFIEGFDYTKIKNIAQWAIDNHAENEYSIIFNLNDSSDTPRFSVGIDRKNNKIMYLPSVGRKYYWTRIENNSQSGRDKFTLSRNQLNFRFKNLCNFINSTDNDVFKYVKNKKLFFNIIDHYYQLIEPYVVDFVFFDIMREKKGNYYSPMEKFVLRIIYSTINFLLSKAELKNDDIKNIIFNELKLELRETIPLNEMKNRLIILLKYIIDKYDIFGKNGIDEYEKLLDYLLSLGDRYVVDDFTISIPIVSKNAIVNKIFGLYDALWYDIEGLFYGDNSFILQTYIEGMSSGELQLLNLAACIDSVSGMDYNLIAFDEPDLSLHPNWIRFLVKYIIEVVKDKNGMYQMIFSTHSPLMISDFLKDNIIRLKRVNGKVEREKVNLGFGSNIAEVFIKDFYLDYPMGEFAKSKLIGLMSKMKDETFVKEKYNELIALNDEVGDPVIKSFINYQLSKYASKQQQIEMLEAEKRRINAKLEKIRNEN